MPRFAVPIPPALVRGALVQAALLAVLVSPAAAERVVSPAPVRAVTVYPQGAVVTRLLRIDGPAGRHELVVTDLPPGIDPATLRVSATGARIGSVSFQNARAVPGDEPASPAVDAARDEVRRREAVLRDRDARVAAIRARAEAAGDAVAFLRALGTSDAAGGAEVDALADNVIARLNAARERMAAAESEARAAEVGREDDVRALDRARAALEALESPENPPAALVVALETEGPAELAISNQTDAASWSPAYDLRLSREKRTLTLDRGLMVSQSTGEDWTDAALVLSTARPSGQAAASTLDPWFPSVEDPSAPMRRGGGAEMADAAAPMAAARYQAEAAPVVANAELDRIGTTIVYRYPAAVTIRTGADAVRLGLDSQQLPVEVVAEAVPLLDETAYLRAEGRNALPDPILPGPAMLFSDGALVGETALPMIAAGDRLELGFGPIEGLRAERRLPEQNEGTRGLIRSANTRDETAVLRIENLTAETWPLRVVDRVPVSRQDQLTVEWTATPKPTETDPDGRRGILVWRSEIAPGAVQEITVTTRMRWPEGQVLVE